MVQHVEEMIRNPSKEHAMKYDLHEKQLLTKYGLHDNLLMKYALH